MVTFLGPETAPQRRPDEIERILSPNEFHGLPYGIRIAQNGHELTREGNPFIEDTGIRTFLIASDALNTFYQNNSLTKEDFYTFLKKNDLGGRVLSLGNEPVHIPPEVTAWTFMVKWVDHTAQNRWRVPDVARFSFTPEEGIRDIITERYCIWNNPVTPVNFSRITRDTMLHIVESPEASDPNYEQMKQSVFSDLRKTLKQQGIPEKQLENTAEINAGKIMDERNKDIVFLPRINSLVINLCRKHIELTPAPPVDVFMHQDIKILKMYVKRNNDLYERLGAASPNEVTNILKGFPNMTMEKFEKHSYGVNGISVDGTLSQFNDEGIIDVPIIRDGGSSEVILWYNAGTIHQREALVLRMTQSPNGIYGAFVRGIEEGTLIDFSKNAATSHARVVYAIEMTAIEEERRRKAMIGVTDTKNPVKKTEKSKFSGPEIPNANDIFFS